MSISWKLDRKATSSSHWFELHAEIRDAAEIEVDQSKHMQASVHLKIYEICSSINPRSCREALWILWVPSSRSLCMSSRNNPPNQFRQFKRLTVFLTVKTIFPRNLSYFCSVVVKVFVTYLRSWNRLLPYSDISMTQQNRFPPNQREGIFADKCHASLLDSNSDKKNNRTEAD